MARKQRKEERQSAQQPSSIQDKLISIDGKVSDINSRLEKARGRRKPHHHILPIAIIVVLLGSGLLLIMHGPEFIGLVTYGDMLERELNFSTSQNATVRLNINGTLTSLRVSGILVGEGTARIWLVAENHSYLVGTVEPAGGLASITGLAVGDVASLGSEANASANMTPEDRGNLSNQTTSMPEEADGDNTADVNPSESMHNQSINQSLENASLDSNVSIEPAQNLTVPIPLAEELNASLNRTHLPNASQNLSISLNETELMGQNASVVNQTESQNKTVPELVEPEVLSNATNETATNVSQTFAVRAFSLLCVETCSLPGIEGSARLFIEVEGGALNLTTIHYTLAETEPHAPYWSSGTDTFLLREQLVLNLSDFFTDQDGDKLSYRITEADNVTLVLDGELLTLVPDMGMEAYRLVTVFAFDGLHTTAQDITLIINTSIADVGLVQHGAVVGQPVAWTRTISTAEAASFEVPSGASNVVVKKRLDGKLTDVPPGTIRKQVGLGVSEAGSETWLINDTGEFEVGYETPGPEVSEIEVGLGRKQVVVSSDFSYQNVLTFTEVHDVPRDSIRLYWYASKEDYASVIKKESGFQNQANEPTAESSIIDDALLYKTFPNGSVNSSENGGTDLLVTDSDDEHGQSRAGRIRSMRSPEERVTAESSGFHQGRNASLGFQEPSVLENKSSPVEVPGPASKVDVTEHPDFDVKFIDSNGDGFIDRLEWITPHLSNQTFEVEIVVLNVQSYPMVGGTWTVGFDTTGVADLTVFASNGTTYGSGAPDDLSFLELRCGDDLLSPAFNGTHVLVEDYNCSVTGYHTVGVHTAGKHTQSFVYGGQVAYAFNTAGNWWNSSFSRCKNITVLNAGDSTLTNFPAYINLSYDSDMQADFDDIRFVDAKCNNGGNLLDYEVENYTASGLAHVWVRIPSLGASGSSISVYYGYAGANSAENAVGVWDNDYVGVWHLVEDEAGTGNTDLYQDSTKYNHDCDDDIADTGKAGRIDGGQDFSDQEDAADCDDHDEFSMTDLLTLEQWWYPEEATVADEWPTMAGKDEAYVFYMDESSVEPCLYLETSGGTEYCDMGHDVGLNQWHYLAWTYDSTSGDCIIYQNGTYKGTTSASGTIDQTAYNFVMGKMWWTDQSYRLDEVRLSNTTRSVFWLNQTYQMVAEQDSFVVYGGEQSQPPDTYLVSPSNGASISDTNVTLRCNASVVDGLELRNISLYTNVSGSWAVNSTIDVREVQPGDNDLVLLLHFNNDSSVGENQTWVYDWSGYGNHGTPGGQAQLNETGRFGRSFDFDGDGDFVKCADDATLRVGESAGKGFTVSQWVRCTSAPAASEVLLTKGSMVSFIDSDGDLGWDFYFEGGDWYAGWAAVDDGEWHHGVATHDGTNTKVWVDGVVVDSRSQEDNLPSTEGTDLYVGAWTGGASNEFDGQIDEVAIWNRSLTTEEVVALYNYSKTRYQANFSLNSLDYGGYEWNCLAFDNDTSSSDWGDANWTFSVQGADALQTNLVSPASGTSVTDTNVTLRCNASVGGSKSLVNISLYTNVSGSWAVNSTIDVREVQPGDNDLVLLYHSNNDSSVGENQTFVYDWSSIHNNGNCSGSVCPAINKTGKIGGSFEFDGDDDHFRTATNNEYDTYEAGTITAWFKSDATGSTQPIISYSTTENDDSIIYWGISNSGDVAVQEWKAPNADWNELTGTTDVADSAWHHVAFVADGSTKVKIYIDGNEETVTLSGTGDGADSDWIADVRTIGSYNHFTDYGALYRGSGKLAAFDGTIDEVTMWNRTLSASEIMAIYNYSKTRYQANFSLNSLDYGGYEWNCLAFDNDTSSSDWGDANWTFSVQGADALQTNLVSPASGTTLTDTNVTLRCNASVGGSKSLVNISLYTNMSGSWTLNQSLTGSSSDWWNDSFSKCRNITISNAGSTTLTDFPAYVNLSYYSGMQADFDDIRFVNTSCKNGGTTLDYEIENYTTSDNAHTWVRIPALPDDGITISVYYGNSTVSSGENPEAVWDEWYRAVYHLAETSGPHYDSTGNRINATEKGGVTQGFDSIVDGGIRTFAGDYVFINATTDFDYTNVTVELWFNSSYAGEYRLLTNYDGAYPWLLTFEDNLGGSSVLFSNSGNSNDNQMTDAQYDDSAWHHVAARGHPQPGKIRIFMDGENVSTSIHDESWGVLDATHPRISQDELLADFDEVRISNITRSADWINQSYRMVVEQGSFVSVDDEESQPAGSLGSYVQANFSMNFSTGSYKWNCLAADNDTSSSDWGDANWTFTKIGNVAAGTVQCEENGTGWYNCANLTWGDSVTAVRVNCTSEDGNIINATFQLANNADSHTFFNANATYNVSDWWYYNNSDVEISDSGQWQLTATCYDDSSNSDSDNSQWTVAWGTLSASLVSPAADTNVTQYRFFSFIAEVSCSGGECGNVNATLDPEQLAALLEQAGAQQLTILNVQSYPMVGGNWTVMFNTSGVANLTITAVDGTTWSDESEENDLLFLEVKCGDDALDYRWVNSSVFVQDYECDMTGFETSRVLRAGKHTQEFKFGGQIAEAYNSAGSWWNSSFTKCKNITIKNAESSTLTNFPAYVNLSYDSDMQADFNDTRFVNTSCNNGGELLDYEVENYTTSDLAHVWVRIPSLPATNITISVYYKNNTAVSSAENATGVWDEYYVGVWHMTETDAVDSTSYSNDGTAAGTVSHDSSGKIDGADDFGGNDDDYISVTDSDSLDVTTDVTLSAWVYYHGHTDSDQDWAKIIDKAIGTSDPWNVYSLGLDNDAGDTQEARLEISTGSAGSQESVESTTTIPINTWTYIVGTYDSSDMRIYINAIDEAQTSTDITIGIIEEDLIFGDHTTAATDNLWDGLLDELRISNVSRTADWINQSYRMVIEQSSYVIFGVEEEQAPEVYLVSPSTGASISDDNVTLRCNASDDNALVNISLYTNMSGSWTLNQTLSVSGKFVQANFSMNFSDGSYKWNCLAFDNASLSDWGDANWTFGVSARGFQSKDVVSMTAGTTPFYTTTANPMVVANNSCLQGLKSGESCTTSWQVNATGSTGNTYEFYLIYGAQNYSIYVSEINSTKINITISSTSGPVVILDSPADGNTTSASSVMVRCNVSDDLEVRNVSLYTNTSGSWSAYAANQSVNTTPYSYNVAITGLSAGSYIWNCYAFDNDSKDAWAGRNWTFTKISNVAAGTVQCEENGTVWAGCGNLTWGDSITAVRVNCTSEGGSIANASFELNNTPDSNRFFNANASYNVSDWWVYNNSDVVINDSGQFGLYVTCFDDQSDTGSGFSEWTVAWGTLSIALVYPNSNHNVSQYMFFNFTINVSCSGGECGNANVTLDPEDLVRALAGPQLRILNNQSFPMVGGTWTVAFNTTGVADLTIAAVNGTSYGEGAPDDLGFLTLQCSEGVVSPVFNGTHVFVEDYNCSVTGYQTVRVHTGGKHTQRFAYGGQVAYAFNLAGINFTGPTPSNATIQSQDFVEINVTIEESSLGQVNYTWNDTTYSLYDNDLILMMNFENLSALGEDDTLVVDLSGYENDGTVVGGNITTSDGKFGRAMMFAGDNDRITISDISGELDLDSVTPPSFSIESWFYPIGTPNDISGISLTAGDGNARLFIRSTSRFGFQLVLGSTYNYPADTCINTWCHVVGVYNSADTSLKLYIDGALKDDDVSEATDLSGASATAYIGWSQTYFKGLMDEVRVWNRSLSAEEVYQHYVSNLYKYDSDKWLLYVNQSKNATAGLDDGTYTYKAFAANSSGYWNGTEERTITIGEEEPATMLVSPPTGTSLTDSNVTLRCNATSDPDLALINISLYTNISGSWAVNSTIDVREVQPGDNDLILLMHFNNDSSKGENQTWVYDWSGNSNHGNCSGAACPDWNASGMFGGAFDYDGSNMGILISKSDSIRSITSEMTISVWINNQNTNSQNEHIISDLKDNAANYTVFLMNKWSNDLTFGVKNISGNVATYDFSGTDSVGVWYNVVVVYNGTHVKGYVNGAPNAASPVVFGGNLAIGAYDDYDVPLHVGRYEYPEEDNYGFNGTIDEVAIWNRSLSATEILAIYNYSKTRYQANFSLNGLGDGDYKWNCLAFDNDTSSSDWGDANWTFTVQGDVAPTVLLTSPASGATDYDGSVTFSCHVTDGDDIKNITLWGNFTGSWDSNESVELAGGSDTAYDHNVTISGLSTGSYVWNCIAFDSSDQDSEASANSTIIVDRSARFKGIISKTVGDTPFYTIHENPMLVSNTSCLAGLEQGGSACEVTWTVNATGNLSSTFTFYAYAQSHNYSGDVGMVNSSFINLTIVANAPPFVESGPTITPASPNTTSTLTCTFTVRDYDSGDTLYANYSWYNWTGSAWDNVVNGSKVVTNGVSDSVTLGSAYLTVGNQWNCSVTPYDENAYGVTESDNITVQNWPARNVSQTLTPSTAYTTTKLSGNLTCEDLDAGDTTKGYCQLYNTTAIYGSLHNETMANNTEANICNVTSDLTKVDDTWIAEFWCGDGTANSSKVNVSVTILARPVNVSLVSPPTGTSITDSNVTLRCNATVGVGNALANISLYTNMSGSWTLNQSLVGSSSDWWNDSFSKCRNITISNAGSTTLTDFPAYVNLSFYSGMQADFDDIRFVNTSCNNDGSLLDYEVENYTTSDMAHVWVRIPSLGASGSSISVYYGYAGANSAENAAGVWDNDYVGVWHLSETSGGANDSTKYGNNGSNQGINMSSPGIVGGGVDACNESDDYIQIPDDTSLWLNETNLTIEVWVYCDDYDGFEYSSPLGKRDSWATMDWQFNRWGTPPFWNWGEENGEQIHYTDDWVEGRWAYYAVTKEIYDYSTMDSDFTNYYDATENSTASSGINWSESDDITIGIGHMDSEGAFDGRIDEVRISNVSRSAQWLNQTYQMMIDQDGFVSIDDEEGKPAGSLGSYVQANFSMKFSDGSYKWNCLAYDNASTPQSGWADANWTFSKGSAAPVSMLVSPANDTSLTDANVTLRCNATSDTGVTLHNISLWTNISGTWAVNRTHYIGEVFTDDNDLVLLMHFNNDSTVGENQTWVYDWSGNGNDGLVTGDAFPNATGRFGKGFEFHGDTDYIDLGDLNASTESDELTVAAWFYATLISGTNIITSKTSWVDHTRSWRLAVYEDAGSNWTYFQQFPVGDGSQDQYSQSGPIVVNQWYHVVGRYNGTHTAFFVNGTMVDSDEDVLPGIHDTSSNTRIGASHEGDNYEFYGIIDEVAIWNRSLSDAEIQQLYNTTKTRYQANFSITGLDNGGYKWNCLAGDNESQSDWNDANWTFRYSNTAPSVSAGPTITPINPSQYDNLTCSFTITDADGGDNLYANWTWYNWTGSAWDAKFKGRVGVTDSVEYNLNLSSANTTYGDRWNCSILPWDETVYGTEESDAVKINNTPPPAVNLSYPPKKDSFFNDRFPAFNWTSITDPDGDSITYHFQLAYDYGFMSLVINNGTLATNLYNYTDALLLSTQYFWRVLANDSINESPWSAIWNFTVQPYVAVAVTDGSMSFTSMFFDEVNDTTDGSPSPFTLRSDGNTECNVTIWGTQLWESQGLDTEYFQYKAREYEAGAYDASASQTTFTNVTAGNSTLLTEFNYTDSKDEAYVDIRLQVPKYEAPGYRSSLVTFYSEESP